MKSYRATYERDESGAWIVSVPAVRGCHTYGLTIEQARRRIREALGLFVDDADRVRIVDDVRLPAVLRHRVRRTLAQRTLAERHHGLARKELALAARDLTGRFGLSLRDTGELLGLSRQRVQQLVATRRASPLRAARPSTSAARGAARRAR